MRWGIFEVQWETTEGFLAEWHELIYIVGKTSFSALRRLTYTWTRRKTRRLEVISVVLPKNVGGGDWG